MAVLFGQGWGTSGQAYGVDMTPSGSGLAHDTVTFGPALNIKGLGVVQDILIFIKVKASTTVGSDKVCNWCAAGSVDGGTTYTGNVSASSTIATFSSDLDQYPNVIFGRPVAVQDTAQQYGGPFSLALLFGGVLPEFAILGVHNRTNVALTNSDTENAVIYQVVYTQA